MNIKAQKGNILDFDADYCFVGIYEDEDWNNNFIKQLSKRTDDLLLLRAEQKDFKGKVGQYLIFSKIVVLGFGKKENIKKNIRDIAGISYQILSTLCVNNVAIELIGEDTDNFDANYFSQSMTEAILLAEYKFLNYKNVSKKDVAESITFVAEDRSDAIRAQKGIEMARLLNEGVKLTRDLVNTPAQDMSPATLSKEAQKISKFGKNIKVQILNKEQIEKNKMNAFLAVNRGSDEDPCLIHIIYKSEKPRKKIALVGKGITFDSGGISLKPSDGMMTMKCDMAGASTVLGIFQILSIKQPKNIEVHGIIAATENMPSAKAVHPGDIVKASNEKTIEILNTDAEGRLTLADAIVYAQNFKPDYLIDIATLTGACVVALGEEVAGIVGNKESLTKELISSGQNYSEPMWELPLFENYKKLIESDIADLRNISTTRYGGVLTAGLFIKEFVNDDQKWAHIDIAGPAFAERPFNSYIGKGATGFGVRSLASWILDL